MLPPIETIAYTCVHKVWKGYAYHRCGKKADSTGLCGRHKPDVIAAAKAKRDAKMEAHISEIHQKEAERKALIRDAARYRWFRDCENIPISLWLNCDGPFKSGEELDAAIDAEMNSLIENIEEKK